MSQFTSEQRYKLEVLLQQNVKKDEIARYLEKDISSIYREVNRNSDSRNKVYKGDLAIGKCTKRHQEKAKNHFFTQEIKTHISTMIRSDLSPEQVVGRSRNDNIQCVSHETIYSFIKKDKKSWWHTLSTLKDKRKIIPKKRRFKRQTGENKRPD
jgi:transposase, IS30 family